MASRSSHVPSFFCLDIAETDIFFFFSNIINGCIFIAKIDEKCNKYRI